MTKQIRVFEVWDIDRVYQGRVQVIGGGEPELYDYPYCEEVIAPPCPSQTRKDYHSKYPDGWYYLSVANGCKAIRQKVGPVVCDEDGREVGKWASYRVIAALEGVKFINKDLMP